MADRGETNPVLTENKMQELITQNREAVQNGTAGARRFLPN